MTQGDDIHYLLRELHARPEQIRELHKTNVCVVIFRVCFGYTQPVPPGLEKDAFRTLVEQLIDGWQSNPDVHATCLARILLLSWKYLRIPDLLKSRIDHECMINDNNLSVILYRLMREPQMTANQLHEFKIALITLPLVLDNEVQCVCRIISSISK